MTWWWETDAWHDHRWLRVAAWLAWVGLVLSLMIGPVYDATWGRW